METSSAKCSDDLQVSLVTGVVVELLGTLCCGLSGLLILDSASLSCRPRLASGLDSLVGVMLVLAGFDLTGGYYSPALALGLKAGCGEAGLTSHLAVYWLGPCLGALAVQPLYTAGTLYLTTISSKANKLD